MISKSAATVCACVIETVHVPVPGQLTPVDEDHPLNVYPVVGIAVSVTGVPCVNDSVQSVPHVMPAPATVPPDDGVTVST